MPSEASVMPNWQAERYWLRSSCSDSARAAPALPSSARSCSEERFERTRPNSAATKKPLTAMRTATAKSSRTVTRRGRVRARRYFEKGRRSWSDAANGTSVIARRQDRRPASAAGQRVDRRRKVEIGLRQAARAVVGHRQPDLVPPVDRDVGVVVGGLRLVGDAVDPGDGGGEVAQLALADDRVALAEAALQRAQALVDLGVGQQVCHILASRMRIVSLVPHATELLYALGLGDSVV